MSVSRRLLCCLCFCLLSCAVTQAQQSRSSLERRKQESLRRIAAAQRILSKTSHVRKASIGQLNTLSKQIEAHETLVAALSDELSYVNSEISETNQVIFSLQEDLQALREEYARMVLWAYKNKLGVNQLTFLFSASSFRQFFLRMKYLTHYAEQRRVQLEAIQKVQQALDLQYKDLSGKRDKQATIFKEEQRRRSKLLSLKKEKEGLIKQLTRRSVQLRRELKQEQAAAARLDKLIKDLIERERREKLLSSGHIPKTLYRICEQQTKT